MGKGRPRFHLSHAGPWKFWLILSSFLLYGISLVSEVQTAKQRAYALCFGCLKRCFGCSDYGCCCPSKSTFSIPIVSISSISIPSTPLEPLLAFTRFHASESTSSRYNKGNTAYSGIPLLYFTSSAYVCKLKSYHIPARSPSLHYKFFQ